MASIPSQPKRLSCVSCRQRKIKCDRVDPCTPCMRAGLKCVFPLPAPPRPRVRPKGKSDQITQRLSRLEGLVTALGGEDAIAEKAKERGFDISSISAPTHGANGAGLGAQLPFPTDGSIVPHGGGVDTAITKPEGGKYPGSNFWSNLSSEVEGLRNLLVESSLDDEEEEDVTTGSSTSHDKDSPAAHFMFGHNHAWMDISHLYPSAVHVTTLLEYYFERFDPVFKVLHRPTILNNVGSFVKESNRFAQGSGEEVLAFAIFLAGVVTMEPEECPRLLQDEKERLLYHYEACVEAALTNADLLNTTSFETLQAFAIYIMCLRSHHKNRTSWSLVSLLIRIATAMDLNTDGSQLGLSTYETEMRRRLWWHVVVLDIQGAEDRGTDQLIFSYQFDTKTPSDINDDDLDAQKGITNNQKKGFTEMTFSLITFEVARAYEYVSFSEPKNPAGRRGFRVPGQEEKEQKVSEVNKLLHSRFIKHCDLSVPIELKASLISQVCMIKLWLLLQYPISARGRGTTPRARAAKDQILSAAVSLLEIQHRVEMMGRVSWAARNWIQWHPLAVCLAELCTQPVGPLGQRAWAAIDAVYESWSEAVADAKSGPLWRPIKKLMEKARKLHGRTDVTSVSNVQNWDGLAGMHGAGGDQQAVADSSIMQLHDHSIAMALDPSVPQYDYQGFAGVSDANMQGFEYYPDAPACELDPVVWEDWDSFLKGATVYDTQVGSSSGSYRSTSAGG